MAEQEKIFTIPLRKKFGVYPRWRRLKIAVRATRDFLVKNLKTENVKIGKYLNLELHKHGRKHPPHHIQVKVWKEKDVYHAELVNAPQEKIVEEPKEKKKEKPELKEQITQVTKAEATKESIEEEKKEVLKHPEEKKTKKEHLGVKRKVKGAQKRGELEHKKEVFSKSQKPSHEKKKS